MILSYCAGPVDTVPAIVLQFCMSCLWYLALLLLFASACRTLPGCVGRIAAASYNAHKNSPRCERHLKQGKKAKHAKI